MLSALKKPIPHPLMMIEQDVAAHLQTHLISSKETKQNNPDSGNDTALLKCTCDIFVLYLGPL